MLIQKDSEQKGPKKEMSVLKEMDTFFELHSNLQNTANDVLITDKDVKEVASILETYEEELGKSTVFMSSDTVKKLKRILANYIALGSPCEIYLALDVGFQFLRNLKKYGPIGQRIIDEINLK